MLRETCLSGIVDVCQVFWGAEKVITFWWQIRKRNRWHDLPVSLGFWQNHVSDDKPCRLLSQMWWWISICSVCWRDTGRIVLWRRSSPSRRSRSSISCVWVAASQTRHPKTNTSSPTLPSPQSVSVKTTTRDTKTCIYLPERAFIKIENGKEIVKMKGARVKPVCPAWAP